eukprot:COSAG01_NODE_2180_length_8215_cov_3.853006_2_plen_92_part_00
MTHKLLQLGGFACKSARFGEPLDAALRHERGALAEQPDLILLNRPPVHTSSHLPVRVQLLAEGEVLAGHPPTAGGRRGGSYISVTVRPIAA